MPLLTVKINKGEEGVFTVLPAGNIDSDTYMILEENVDTILNPPPKTLIFDMKDVKYISSMGITVILAVKEKVTKGGGNLVMIDLQPQIRKVFDIIRAIPSNNIFSSREELDSYLIAMQQEEVKNKKVL